MTFPKNRSGKKHRTVVMCLCAVCYVENRQNRAMMLFYAFKMLAFSILTTTITEIVDEGKNERTSTALSINTHNIHFTSHFCEKFTLYCFFKIFTYRNSTASTLFFSFSISKINVFKKKFTYQWLISCMIIRNEQLRYKPNRWKFSNDTHIFTYNSHTIKCHWKATEEENRTKKPKCKE